MILVRLIFQARFGKVNEVVAGFMQAQEMIRQRVAPNARVRLLTDLSGPFNTVVQEIEVESLAEWEQMRARLFADPQFRERQAGAPDVVESGRTEFYTIEDGG